MSHEAYSTDEFDRALRALPRADGKRVSQAITDRLCADPRHNTKLLAGRYAGLRSFRVGDIRVIFLIVAEARAAGIDNRKPHLSCAGLPEEALKLLYVGFRKNVYGWNP